MVSHLHPDLSMSRPGCNTFPAETDYNDRFCKKLGKKRKKILEVLESTSKGTATPLWFWKFSGEIEFF